jgi:hypothetical protein
MTQSEHCKTVLTNNAWLASKWKEDGWGESNMAENRILTGSGCEPKVMIFILVSFHLYTAGYCRTSADTK